MTATIVERCRAAVIAVMDFKVGGRGTAVAIRPNLLITCHHLVKDFADKIYLVNHNSKTYHEVDIAGIDENRDLTLLHRKYPLEPTLQFEDEEALDDSTPLLVWSWPGWNALEEEGVDPSGIDFKPTPHAAVMTECWTENNISLFSFAGHIEAGMSGGAVVSALSRKIFGIAISSWIACSPEIAREVVETWFLGIHPDNLGEQELRSFLDPTAPIIKAIRAQLVLGMGVALAVKEIRSFLDSDAPKAL